MIHYLLLVPIFLSFLSQPILAASKECGFVRDLLALDKLHPDFYKAVRSMKEGLSEAFNSCRNQDSCLEFNPSSVSENGIIEYKITDDGSVINVVHRGEKHFLVIIPKNYLQTGLPPERIPAPKKPVSPPYSAVIKSVTSQGRLAWPTGKKYEIQDMVEAFRRFYLEYRASLPANTVIKTPKYHADDNGIAKRFEYVVTELLGLKTNKEVADVVNNVFAGQGKTVTPQDVWQNRKLSSRNQKSMAIILALTEWVGSKKSSISELTPAAAKVKNSEKNYQELWSSLEQKKLVQGSFSTEMKFPGLLEAVANHKKWDADQIEEFKTYLGVEGGTLIRGTRVGRVLMQVGRLSSEDLSAIEEKKVISNRVKVIQNLVVANANTLSRVVNLQDLPTDSLSDGFASLRKITNALIPNHRDGERGSFWGEIFRKNGTTLTTQDASALGGNVFKVEGNIEEGLFNTLTADLNERLQSYAGKNPTTNPAQVELPLTEKNALKMIESAGILENLLGSDKKEVMSAMDKWTNDQDEITFPEILNATVIHSGKKWVDVAKQSGIDPKAGTIPSKSQLNKFIDIMR